MGLLGLTDSANSSAQYSLESGGIKIGDISKEGVQRGERDRDWQGSWGVGVGHLPSRGHRIVPIILTT